MSFRSVLLGSVLVLAAGLASPGAAQDVQLLNVSYDPTRELYREFNEKFAAHWLAKTGQRVVVRQSHSGSGAQARAVIDGLEADVVTLGLAWDVDALHLNGKKLNADWQSRLPNNSAPYTSTVVFLVRAGNPKGIHDWPDLLKPGIEIITPNPKTSGGARWNYLAAWGYALEQALDGDLSRLKTAPATEVAAAQQKAQQFVSEVYRRVPMLDTGARGATNTFVQRRLGDVLLAWENEALLALDEMGRDAFEVVTPSVSILAEPTVAWVDTVIDRKGTRAVAEAYLKYLYTPEGQEIIARNHFRPRDQTVAAQFADRYPQVRLFTVDDVFGGWSKTQPEHFNDGGKFDQLYQPGGR
jgi:sulfate/thiosulfate transport system substrate-binding protein